MSSGSRTTIVGTIGPASQSAEVLRSLIGKGLDVARLNFSHGDHESQQATYDAVRGAEAEVGRPVAVLQDLCGPKIRVGVLKTPVPLKRGEQVELYPRDDFEGEGVRIPTSFASLLSDVQPGDPIYLADGRFLLRAVSVEEGHLTAEVEVGGELLSKKGINLPKTPVSSPSITDKDRRDLKFGLAMGVDLVAASFVRTPRDIEVLREEMTAFGRQVPIVAKIEKPEAVQYLDAIIDSADGIMVARGDLGVEVSTERVPGIQRRAIRAARERGKLSIVATQMLVSMTERPRPTHAEVSDVANAVFDGADCLMLSEETAMGRYPVEAVEVMASLARAAEREMVFPAGRMDAYRDSVVFAIAQAAVVTAKEVKAKAIVSYTHMGTGPRILANLRPPCQIIGCATEMDELRRLCRLWGVRPMLVAQPSTLEELIDAVVKGGKQSGTLQSGDTFVLVSKIPFTQNDFTNMLKVHQVP